MKKSIVEDKRSVLLFPEGTRTKCGAEAKCRGAINFIQKNNDYAAICPIVINTGKFWGKNSFIKYPGVAKIKFLPLIDKDENYKTINNVIEKIFNENNV